MFDAKKFSDLLIEVQGNRSLNEYARNSGVSAAYISKLKNMAKKTPPSPIIIRKLASKSGRFTSSLADSVSYTALMEAAGFTSLLLEGEEEADAIEANLAKIAILGSVSSRDFILAEENINGYRYEYKNNVPERDLFLLEAKGNSMEPIIPNGCIVLIQVQEEVKNGEIAAFINESNNEVILRKLKVQGNIKFLMPENMDYEPVIITEENTFTTLGKVIRITIDLK